MIRKFLLVNENVTDFCCVLEFMDITGSCIVFGHLVGPFIFSSSKTKRLQMIIDWKINCFRFKTEKLKDPVGSGPKKSEISCNGNQ